MDLETRLNECRFYVNQIKHFDPDPSYVRKFFMYFLHESHKIVNGIFKEADSNFGFFVKEINPRSFRERALEKDDKKALEFYGWFNKRYEQEHQLPYLRFILRAKEYLGTKKELPLPTVKLITKERYHKDPCHPIPVQFEGNHITQDSLKVSIQQFGNLFVEQVNKKRKEKMEPTVSTDKIVATCFLPLEASRDEEQFFEITRASELYLTSLRDIVAESREKIKLLTSFK